MYHIMYKTMNTFCYIKKCSYKKARTSGSWNIFKISYSDFPEGRILHSRVARDRRINIPRAMNPPV